MNNGSKCPSLILPCYCLSITHAAVSAFCHYISPGEIFPEWYIMNAAGVFYCAPVQITPSADKSLTFLSLPERRVWKQPITGPVKRFMSRSRRRRPRLNMDYVTDATVNKYDCLQLKLSSSCFAGARPSVGCRPSDGRLFDIKDNDFMPRSFSQ